MAKLASCPLEEVSMDIHDQQNEDLNNVDALVEPSLLRHPHKLAKLRHVNACMLAESQYVKSAGFGGVELPNEPAAGLNLDDVSLATEFLNHTLKAPLMIAPMTGGMELGAMLNQRFAQAAEHFGLAFGVGSQRLMLMDETALPTFRVRPYARTALIFANLGAAQILHEKGAVMAQQAVDFIQADALFLHLNPLQEACQEHGDTQFSGLLKGISAVVTSLRRHNIPVFVREVGFGMSKTSARALIETGIDGLDCAGAGGTSWAKVEAMCASNERYQKLGQALGEWGIPTVSSIANVRMVNQTIPLIATGGLRSGLDIAKAIALGADMGAMAQPMLLAAIKGEDALFAFIDQILLELRVAMFAAGKSRVAELKNAVVIRN